MSFDPDCVFCKIIKGDIPSFKVFEDEQTFAFMDINPANTGHALVIPKFHTPNLYDIPAEWLSATVTSAQKVARAIDAVVKPDGMNLLQANGEGAAQSVFHFHLHVMPRFNGDELKLNWGLKPGDMEAIGALAEKIRAMLD